MALAGIVYEPAPRPNALGQALQGAASTIGAAHFQAAQLRKQEDEKLATLFLSIAPKLQNNPAALERVTKDPEFGRIRAAMTRTGLGSVISQDPTTGGLSVNIPADPVSTDALYAQLIQSSGATPEAMQEALLSYKQADPYTKYLLDVEKNKQAQEAAQQLKQTPTAGEAIKAAAGFEELTQDREPIERRTLMESGIPVLRDRFNVFGAKFGGRIPKRITKTTGLTAEERKRVGIHARARAQKYTRSLVDRLKQGS